MSLHSLPWPKKLKPLLLSCKDKDSLAKIHALFVLTGLIRTTHGNSNATLVKKYVNIVDTAQARKLFDKLPHRGVDVWNAMAVAYSREKRPEEVVKLHLRMVSEGVKPDSSSFTVALKACASLSDLETGEEIWVNAIVHGYELDSFVGSSVLSLYSKCGKINEAQKVFSKMPKWDLVCWTSMISGFVKCDEPSKAVDFFRRMKDDGTEPDGVVMLALVQACASLGDLRLGLSVHGNFIRRELEMDILVRTSLVDMYAKTRNLNFAFRVFKEMNHKTVISWGALISGYARNGFSIEALELLVEMQSIGLKPDKSSLVSALLACSKIGSMKLGTSVHGYIIRSRLDSNQILGTALIDLYTKCGSISYARSIFDRTETYDKDSIFWNAMISGYAIHGLGEEALSLFSDMTAKTSLKPDRTTFASLLSACSHSGLVEQGQFLFNEMLSKYKIFPEERHYLCAVDLLARSGKVEEAYQLIGTMGSEPGLSIWVALLAGCYNQDKLRIGDIAAKKILGLGPRDSGILALISNLYSKERKWSEVASLRTVMKQMRTKKMPGYSSIEVNCKFHSFVKEDNSHDRYQDIIRLLKNLDREMRITGLCESVFHNLELS